MLTSNTLFAHEYCDQSSHKRSGSHPGGRKSASAGTSHQPSPVGRGGWRQAPVGSNSVGSRRWLDVPWGASGRGRHRRSSAGAAPTKTSSPMKALSGMCVCDVRHCSCLARDKYGGCALESWCDETTYSHRGCRAACVRCRRRCRRQCRRAGGPSCLWPRAATMEVAVL
jgi:hypothetical protein